MRGRMIEHKANGKQEQLTQKEKGNIERKGKKEKQQENCDYLYNTYIIVVNLINSIQVQYSIISKGPNMFRSLESYRQGRSFQLLL
jgi:hypothetical protein